MGDYRALRVWQKAHALTLRVYQATESLPKHELYGLTSQLRRAAASIPANIAEGTGRDSQAELARFCRIALGSANALEYHLLLAHDLGYLSRTEHDSRSAEVSQIRRMLIKFVEAL